MNPTWMARNPTGPRSRPMDMKTRQSPALAAYDPQYDPLVASKW
jgi:hypothetical protein